MRWLGYTFAGVLALTVLLVLIDSVYEPECLAEPKVGTVIDIPGESMQIIDHGDPDQVWFDVVREPFREGYELDPAHGHVHPNQAEGFEVLEGSGVSRPLGMGSADKNRCPVGRVLGYSACER